jgi:hypothetical protein
LLSFQLFAAQEAIRLGDAEIAQLNGEVERLHQWLEEEKKQTATIGNMPAIVKSVDYGAETLAQCVEMAIDRFYKMGQRDGAKAARADAIGEAIEAAKAERLHENLDNDSDCGYANAIECVITALESLIQQRDDDQESTPTGDRA